MTRTRQLVAFVLALALCVGLMVPAMAADAGTQYEKTAGDVAKTVASPGLARLAETGRCSVLPEAGQTSRAGILRDITRDWRAT